MRRTPKILSLTAIFCIICLISGCTYKKVGAILDQPDVVRFHLSPEFLVSEWRIDSIAGDDRPIEEWVYFTDDAEFWRFSYSGLSYVKDRKFSYKDDRVSIAGQPVYRISMIDSNNIQLADMDGTKYHATRWMSFDRSVIDQYLHSDSLKKHINGSWVLDTAEILPASYPTQFSKNFCGQLTQSSRVFFRANGSVDVYTQGSNAPCKSYTYKLYNMNISLNEIEMDYEYDIEELTDNHMVIREEFGDYNKLVYKRVDSH